MKLRDLLDFNNIVIQCHDNPDADALASGYALYWYLETKGKKPRFIYRGPNRITKSNLLIMIDELDIPVEYAPDFDENPELLITVDCQYGQRNVTRTKAETIAVIDHHQQSESLPELSYVRSNIGSCSTILFSMIGKEGLDVNENPHLATSLYYGLYTDTNKLSEVSHPLDRDMMEDLAVNHSLITTMSNSNISLDELLITGRAIISHEYFENGRYLIMETEPCDPNILGVISDFALETEGVDVCLAYYVSQNEVKFSVRSCIKEVHADELAAYLAEGYGGGGGHRFKAGGSMRPEKLDISADDIFHKRMEAYFEQYEVIYASETEVDMSNMKLYSKLPQKLGCVKLTDVFPCGTMVSIRALEGDVTHRIDDDDYLMIGIEGEIYPILGEKLRKSYKLTEEKYEKEFEYVPQIRNSTNGVRKSVMDYAKTVVSLDSSCVYARPLTKSVKVFTTWDEENYYLGDPGDYLIIRNDDIHDIYVIKKHLFCQLYGKAKSVSL